jgi:Tfp pilus assembly protein PilN
MRQNINLISTVRPLIISPFNATLMAQIIGGWIIILVLIYSFATAKNIFKQKDIDELKATQTTLQKKLRSINIKTNKVKILSSKETEDISIVSGNLVGFHHYLEELAKAAPKDMWLNSFSFTQPGNHFSFKGHATSAADVTIFVSSLNRTKTFKNKNFGALQIQRKPGSKNISFTLNTRRAKPK